MKKKLKYFYKKLLNLVKTDFDQIILTGTKIPLPNLIKKKVFLTQLCISYVEIRKSLSPSFPPPPQCLIKDYFGVFKPGIFRLTRFQNKRVVLNWAQKKIFLTICTFLFNGNAGGGKVRKNYGRCEIREEKHANKSSIWLSIFLVLWVV